ncbi:MAG: hypothetical protein JSS61_05025 [Verrucomicrobia bacterium]|nr:hypothetical protein [Verrucomicrobiota bacterium]
MKRHLPLVGLVPLFFLTTSYELITNYGFVDKENPLHFDAEYRHVAPAKFRTASVKGSKATYDDAHAYLYYSHYLTPDNSLSWKVGYSALEFDWSQNPRFRGDHYHFASASLGWVSTSIQDWRWILATGVSVDTHTFNFGKTGVYYGMMWGRYQFSPNIGMHIGWCGYVGVENGYVLPILGIDWSVGKHWQFNGIFPVNLSIQYNFNASWAMSIEAAAFGRPYRFPMRVHDGIGKFDGGIFEVYSKGVELDLKYRFGNNFYASIGGGWNFGGWILIKDHANHHGKYYKFDDAPYGQARLGCTF